MRFRAGRQREFERAANCQKREIASEIVGGVLMWNPPGRFLARARPDGAGKCGPEVVEAFFREVDVDAALVGSSAAYFVRMGFAREKNRKLKRKMGPWRDIGIDTAIQKAMSVIWDHRRLDRVALRAMGCLMCAKTEPYTVSGNVSSVSVDALGHSLLASAQMLRACWLTVPSQK